jgi:cyanophycin synthetase
MISHILGQAGLRVGMATTDGVYCGGQLIHAADASGPRSAEMVLDDSTVEAAVLETARGGIIRRGLGYDRADVAVVTNISADHLGCDGIDDLDDLTGVKALVAEEIVRGGTVVLNADDPRSAGLAQRPAVRERDPVVRLFSLSASGPGVVAHRMSGGIACLLRDGQLIEARGGEETVLLHADELPGSFGGAAAHLLANALAAAAACRALGVSVKDIRRGFATFTRPRPTRAAATSTRSAGYRWWWTTGTTPAALASMGRLLHEAWDGQPIAAITLPGDRRDDLIEESAATVATWFSRVVVYEDRDLRGREPGEITRLISAALTRHRPDIAILTAGGPDEALRAALALASPADPVLLTYETLGPVHDLLTGLGAIACPGGPGQPRG